MILYLGCKVILIIVLRKFNAGLDNYSNFSKIVIEGISNARWVSYCFIINCDNGTENMVTII